MIYEPQIEKIPIGQIKLDPDNPNKMNAEQMKGLEKSLKDFGNVVPVVVDENNMIIDGEHRLLVYRDALGLKEIPAFRIQTTDPIKRKLVRQTLNKLKGFIDPEKDILEMLQIEQHGSVEDLSELIAMDRRHIEQLIDSIQRNNTVSIQPEQEIEMPLTTKPEQRGEEQGDYHDFGFYDSSQVEQEQSKLSLTFEFETQQDYDFVVSVLGSMHSESITTALIEAMRRLNQH
jgi:hypothetical protein